MENKSLLREHALGGKNEFPKVFVIVLNYNGREFIRKCLTGLFKVNYPNLEIVVVDNNSSDGSLETARTLFPKAHFIKNEENLGFAVGNNIGIKFALERMAEWILLLNQDTEVESNFLEELITVVKKNPAIGVASPLIFWGNSEKIWFSGGKINWWNMKSIQENNLISQINSQSDFISGCAMLVKKEVFSKIGLLDEDFFLYWEDADFTVRAKKAGFELAVVPQSRIRHFEKNMESAGEKIYWLVISGLIFFKKNATAKMKIWLAPYCLLRRIKNYIDVKKGKKEAFFVQKAYRDFRKVCQNKK